ncbi:hypothetical protein [Bartonella tamiae]|uniref:hypothetical protein n=1 Tax=Bartonella tamiae TaxID=373638 RepID=UPI00026E77A8|nr:hypothetical protein [Bartonella tamiae]EJF92647.1 hypothetical protein MEG_01817 [Bartonella tamiae Th307]
MTYSIHLTQDWPFERIAKYADNITKAILRIRDKFPDDVDIDLLAKEIATGKRQLWIILDEKEQFAAFVTTEIEITKLGNKRVLLLELAGKGGAFLADMIVPIENWAKSIGATEICPYGRIGWLKRLKKHGFKPDVIKYKKELI